MDALTICVTIACLVVIIGGIFAAKYSDKVSARLLEEEINKKPALKKNKA